MVCKIESKKVRNLKTENQNSQHVPVAAVKLNHITVFLDTICKCYVTLELKLLY